MTDDTQELFTPGAFQRWLILAAVAVVIAGIALGIASRRSLGSARAALQRGAAVAFLGPLALLLWWLYNLIEDHYGLDSVPALLINLALFVVVGLTVGAVMAWIWRSTGRPGDNEGAADSGS